VKQILKQWPIILVSMLFLSVSYAVAPVWTFTPLTATTVSVPPNGSAIVQYTVTNQSYKDHTLIMKDITGVTQITTGSGVCGNPFVLPGRASCTLTLQINGSQAMSGNTDGPSACEHGSILQCYRPSPPDTLVIIKSQYPLPKFAYVANDNNLVLQCPVNSDGTFGACVNSGNSGVSFDGPNGITFNQANTIAYVTNYPGRSVLSCPVNTNGTFGACIDSGNVFNIPSGITLNLTGNKAYVTDQGNDTTLVCPINNDGTLGTCIDSGGTGAAFNNPAGITLDASGTKAYITNAGNASTLVCPINSDGTFGSCIDSGRTGATFSNPVGIVLNTSGTKAYITNSGNNTVSVCPINPGGTFGSCVSHSDALFNQPVGISLNNTDVEAYITNNNNSSVSICQINSDGTFSSCRASGNSGIAFSGPEGIYLVY